MYLGIPTIVGRLKKVIFEALVDRVWNKLKGWKEKHLLRARKEFLLKCVIQAIPTYVMGIYRVLVAIIHKIHSYTANFFWGQETGRRKIHGRSWEVLCSPKCLGGLGFHDLSLFNIALLDCQAWRLIKREDTLLARVFKVKYFPNYNFLDSVLGFAGGFSWKSIWCTKSLVKEGIL